ncbi:MAG: hypothetical protein J0M25_06265 [Flavobacteriales bacterium]|jgi:hypothetical protein|uniref:hypothetical protein n=1 Tax=Flavobacterium sp. TaxID=239 RepID=UPI001AC2B0B3|nr:hypothetical protein [Flavobacteriales bacterium]
METKQNKKVEALKIEGDWSQQAKELKKKFPTLTDSDVKFERGREEDLIKRMESRLHKNREEVILILRRNQTATN